MFPIFFIVIIVLLLFSAIMWKSVRASRRTEYIRTFTLPPGLFRRLQKRRPELEWKDCQLVAKGLRQFFLAYHHSGHKFVAMPSQVADELWHEFILYTRHYEDFCQRAFGRFLHHTPAVILQKNPPKNNQGNAGLRRCWWHACKDEVINPQNASRLPLLFALDAKFNIADGFFYEANCQPVTETGDQNRRDVYCGGDFSSASHDGGTDGFDSGSSSDGDSSSGGSSDSSSDSGGDSGGGCGGGGCGGGD